MQGFLFDTIEMITDLTNKIIFIGASTGGTEALAQLLSKFPVNCPPTLIVQHMPAMFTKPFAERLDQLSKPHVVEATQGEKIKAGHVYIAPGHSHLKITKSILGYTCMLNNTERVGRHMPAVDVLFNSAAKIVGDHAIGIILTGMGKDGANGLLHMKRAGAYTIGQDEQSCVVYGMPREAALIGALDIVLPLKEIAAHVMPYK